MLATGSALITCKLVRAQDDDALVSRFMNLQAFEMTPQVHPVGNVSVSRYSNLQAFEITSQMHPPGDASTSRVGNVQAFEMEYQIHEIQINTTRLEITDQNGNPVTNFTQGDLIEINFTVRNLGVPFSQAIISVTITNPSDSVVFLTYTFEDFSLQMMKTFVFGYRIPSDALTGTYTVKTMIFTDWPSEGGVGLDMDTAAFNVS